MALVPEAVVVNAPAVDFRPDGGQRPGGGGAPGQGGSQRGGSGSRLMQMDANHDGIIQGSELPEEMRERILEHLDKNGDGVIDQQELQAAASGGRPGGGKPGGGKRRGSAEDENESGSGVKPKRPAQE